MKQKTAKISYNTNNPVLADSRVFVGNLRSEQVNEDTLLKIFKKYGAVTGLSIHKGFGFIQYSNEKNARAAVEGANGTELFGQRLDCRIASEGGNRGGRVKRADRDSRGSGMSTPTQIIPDCNITPELVKSNALALLSECSDISLEQFEARFSAQFGYSLNHASILVGYSNSHDYLSQELGDVLRLLYDSSNAVFLKVLGSISLPREPDIQQQMSSTLSSWVQAALGPQEDSPSRPISKMTPIDQRSLKPTKMPEPILAYVEYQRITFIPDIMYKVYLAHCENPSNLVAQIYGPGFSMSLDELNDEMSKLYNDPTQMIHYQVPDSFFCIGQCCVAQYDYQYYRAIILNVSAERKSCVVLYVDYGNEDVVSFEDIRALDEEFMILAMQGIQVSLANLVAPTNAAWNPDVKSLIDEYQDLVLDCTLVHVDARQLFVDLTHGKKPPLSELLIAQGYAKKQNIDYGQSCTIAQFPPCSRYQKLEFTMKSRQEGRYKASPSSKASDSLPGSAIPTPVKPVDIIPPAATNIGILKHLERQDPGASSIYQPKFASPSPQVLSPQVFPQLPTYRIPFSQPQSALTPKKPLLPDSCTPPSHNKNAHANFAWETSTVTIHSLNDSCNHVVYVVSGDYTGNYISILDRMKLTKESVQHLLNINDKKCILVPRTFQDLYSKMSGLKLLYNNEMILCDLDKTYIALNALSSQPTEDELLDGLLDVILKVSVPQTQSW